MLITDGLDRDAGTGLAREMDRLHRSCRRLIWLNPLLRYEGFEPRSLGMRAMMPYVDEFRPVHNLESLEELIEVLSAAPARRGPAAPVVAALSGEGGMSDTAEILEQAARWREAGSGVALATVVTTWGSSPRPVGAKLAVDDKGAMVGSVSGGCVEGAVVAGGAGGDPRRQAAAARFRGQRRPGLGSRPRLRRQDPDLCRARRMKGGILDRGRRRRA